MQDYEKLGLFYLGRLFDLKTKQLQPDLLLYQSKDLTTHAVCVGMTGSGKTGLCLTLLEEAAIDGIPVIAIDPKGDLGNLLLAFPELRPNDFEPWIDADEAARKGMTSAQWATQVAETWQKGLAAWQQDGARVARYRDSVDMAIYTPGSDAGLPLTVLRSFAAPPAGLIEQGEAFRERVASAVSGLLALVGMTADPVTSREHILLANILDHTWRAGKDLDLDDLIRAIQAPPFERVGVVDLEAFFPAKARFALAMELNNLLASPSFAGWLKGEPLDIARLLHTPAGKPRLSVLSIAHLSDSERMSFVTILLGELAAWMRTQPGTSSLRAILYMDEVFGYFPPTANPPSKIPMLTLLKQARAFGLGVVLATQNPVDLDYKGLSNAGTWFLGRLQTERDKARVLEGLEGASAAAGAMFNRAQFSEILAGLGNRVFLMNNVHDDHPVVFQTRWALSYLHGPLARDQIERLMAPRRTEYVTEKAAVAPVAAPRDHSAQRPVLPPDVPEFFFAARGSREANTMYRPALLGTAKIHFRSAKEGIDVWRDLTVLQPVSASLPEDVWQDSQVLDETPDLLKQPESNATFAAIGSELSRAKFYGDATTALKDYLYRQQVVTVWKCAALRAVSKADETEGDFRARMAHTSREKRDEEIEKIRDRYAVKLAALEEQERRAQQRVEKEKGQAWQSIIQAVLAAGSSLLGALTGRKMASSRNVNRATSAARAAGRAAQQHSDVGQATETVEAIQQRHAEMESQLQQECQVIEAAFKSDGLKLDQVQIRPKKADISIDSVKLVWLPGGVTATDQWQPCY